MKASILCSVMILCALLPGYTTHAQKSDSDETLLYEADFSAGTLPNSIQATPGWEVVSIEGESGQINALQGTAAGDSSASFIVLTDDSITWTDYAVDLRARFSGDLLIGILSHVQFEASGCISGNNALVIPIIASIDIVAYSGSDCGDIELGSSSEAEFPLDEWIDLRIETAGDSMTILINGEAVASASGSPTEAGTFGISLNQMNADIASLRVTALEGSASNTTASSTRVTLTSFGEAHQTAVAEMVEKGVVPATGSLLFYEDYAFFRGQGAYFTPLARSSRLSDVLMAGELTFDSAGDAGTELCSLGMRILTDNSGRTSNSVTVGFVNDGSLLLREVANGESSNSARYNTALDLSEPHHLMMRAIGGELTVFVDGELIVDDFEITPLDGFFGIALISSSRESRCEGRNIWVYKYE